MAQPISIGGIDAFEDFLSGAEPGTTGALATGAAGGFLDGTNGQDTLLGGDGTDVIDARGGDDRASGSSGDDLVLGGSGDDHLTGDGALASPIPPPPFPSAGGDTVVGGGGDDTLYGDGFVSYDHFGDEAGGNLLFGGAGNDVITAGYGADTASGGSGGDLIFGYGSAPSTGGSGGEAARERDLGDVLFGGAGDDTVDGGGGADTIDGGAGADRLEGSYGNDTLTGGPGADLFVFGFRPVFMARDTGQGEGDRDVVTDFRSGVDVLDATGYRSPSVTWAYDEAGDRTIVTIVDPRTGLGFPDLEIELAGVRNLAAGDILV